MGGRTPNMIKETGYGMLNIILNENISESDHGITADVKEVVERWVCRYPIANLFKYGDQS